MPKSTNPKLRAKFRRDEEKADNAFTAWTATNDGKILSEKSALDLAQADAVLLTTEQGRVLLYFGDESVARRVEKSLKTFGRLPEGNSLSKEDGLFSLEMTPEYAAGLASTHRFTGPEHAVPDTEVSKRALALLKPQMIRQREQQQAQQADACARFVEETQGVVVLCENGTTALYYPSQSAASRARQHAAASATRATDAKTSNMRIGDHIITQLFVPKETLQVYAEHYPERVKMLHDATPDAMLQAAADHFYPPAISSLRSVHTNKSIESEKDCIDTLATHGVLAGRVTGDPLPSYRMYLADECLAREAFAWLKENRPDALHEDKLKFERGISVLVISPAFARDVGRHPNIDDPKLHVASKRLKPSTDHKPAAQYKPGDQVTVGDLIRKAEKKALRANGYGID